MKKVIVIIFSLFLMLGISGCNTKTTTELSPMSVMVPNGAPALAQLFMQDMEMYNVDVVVGADPLVAAFGSGSHDFIFAPTNLGAKLYNSGINYQMISAVTFGNYYLASDENDFKLSSLEGKEIVVFGQNATSDIILRYILSENEINASFTYVNSVSEANASFIADNSKIILSAEPMLSILKQNNPDITIIDVQAEYKKITGESSYPQAGVFAKESLSDEEIEKFLTDLESSINKVNSDLESSAAKAAELEYSFSEAVLMTAIPNSNIAFVRAKDVRTDLEKYFNIILEMNSALLGDTLPDDNFYYE